MDPIKDPIHVGIKKQLMMMTTMMIVTILPLIWSWLVALLERPLLRLPRPKKRLPKRLAAVRLVAAVPLLAAVLTVIE